MSSSAATAKLILAALRKAYKQDRANAYSLPKPVTFFFRGVTPEWHGTYFDFNPQPDASLGTVGTFVTLNAYGHLDAAGRTINDGATLAPDSIPGAKEGAAVHDPGYLEMAAIAKAWANEPYAPGPDWGRDWLARRFSKGSAIWTRADVRQMFDNIFGDAMVESGAGVFACLYHSTARVVGGLFHDVLAIRPTLALAAASVLILAGCYGCQTPPDIVDWIEGLPQPVKVDPVDSVGSAEPSPSVPTASDAVPYAGLTWRIARTRPSVATPAITALIKKGSLSSNQLTFSWLDTAGAGKALGSSTHDPAELRAYIFFGGEGGFFDWCSVTRSQRDFKNITGTWEGWDKVDRSRRPVTFFIGSKDGKTRTNIISFD